MKVTKEQNLKNKKTNTNKGITLIALVITIVVMLILVSVTISMAVNGGLFEYAGKAVSDTQNAIDKEQQLAGGKVQVDGMWYNSIDDYIEGEVALLSYEETPTKENGILKANAKYTTTENGKTYTAIVPKGFKKIPGINGSTNIGDGLVIQDEEGNEFVWIPVTYTAKNTDADKNGYDDGFDSVFYRSDWVADAANGGKRGTTKYTETTGDSYNEPYASGYTDGKGTEEIKEYNEMVKSVYENGGFYIGRYEAGAQKQDANENIIARTYTDNGTSKMVVQRDQYPYIYVGWGSTMSSYTGEVTYDSKKQGLGALALSKGMYAKKDVGVTSTLCYGIQWDAMLDFIKDSNHDVTNSKNWGNYKDNPWEIDRKEARYATNPISTTTWKSIDEETEDKKTKDETTSILLTTGASDKFAAKNIYDIAGNVSEWTNEAYSSTHRVSRGGAYYVDGSSVPASNRSYNTPESCNNAIGFRPTLYIK